MLGSLLAVVAFLRVLISSGASTVAWMPAITLSVALLLTVMSAAVLGSATPMLLQRLGVDPAVGAGPALSTLTDIAGVLLLCIVASALLENH